MSASPVELAQSIRQQKLPPRYAELGIRPGCPYGLGPWSTRLLRRSCFFGKTRKNAPDFPLKYCSYFIRVPPRCQADRAEFVSFSAMIREKPGLPAGRPGLRDVRTVRSPPAGPRRPRRPPPPGRRSGPGGRGGCGRRWAHPPYPPRLLPPRISSPR